MPAAPIQLAQSSSSGIEGDSKAGGVSNVFGSFAVGSGADAKSDGGISNTTIALLVGGVLVVGVLGFVLLRRR